MENTKTSISRNQLGLAEQLIASWPIIVGILVGLIVVLTIVFIMYKTEAYKKLFVYKKDIDRERNTIKRQTMMIEERRKSGMINLSYH